MTRGNQREKAREKNMKKQQIAAKQKKSGEDGSRAGLLSQKKERDADIMRQKQQKALDKKTESGGAVGESGGAVGGASK